MALWIERDPPYRFTTQNPADDAREPGWTFADGSQDHPSLLCLGGQHPKDITGDPDPSHWMVVGGSVVLKAQGEIDAQDLAKTRAQKYSLAVQAQSDLLSLAALKERLDAAGATATAATVQAKINTLDAQLVNAIGNLP